MWVNNGLENIHSFAKELLGAVREKYSTVPIPGSGGKFGWCTQLESRVTKQKKTS